ncbi:MAG: hydrogenase expression/formation protein [Aquificaceae bacterium]|nr:hydrogenase expression/formation protein [Aquificaceae bacterium]
MLMNAPAILNELVHALKNLYEKGEEHIIYINKLPLSEEDRLVLLDILGEGQVKIRLGSKTHPAEWRETGISGVWIGVFYDRDSNPILETIEVCYYPSLAKAQREDIQESITRLKDRIESILSREF